MGKRLKNKEALGSRIQAPQTPPKVLQNESTYPSVFAICNIGSMLKTWRQMRNASF